MISESAACHEAALTGRLTFLNTGSGVAGVCVYGGVRPATAADAPGSTVLVQIDLTNPAGSVATGSLTLTPVGANMVTASGLATWARVVNRNGDTAFDMDAGAIGSGAECELSDDTLFAGGMVTISSATLG